MEVCSLDILIFGHDRHLTYPRELLLQKAGHSVAAVDTQEDFQSTFLQRPAKIILLCQTLTPKECRDCEEFAKERHPDVLVLVLFHQRCKSVPGTGGVLLRSGAGPAALLGVVRDMLHRYASVQHPASAWSF